VSKTLELVGSFLPMRRTVIVAEVDGVIEKIPVPTSNPVVVEDEGQRESLPLDIGAEIRKGDLLVKLDGSDYERGLKAEEARLEQAERELEKLKDWR
jgi:multidrug resistance efflux pump